MKPSRLDLLDLVEESIIVRDIDGRIREWNRAATDIYGWTRDQALGRPAHELLRTSGIALEEIEALVRKTGDWSGDIERKTSIGRKLTIKARWRIRDDDSGMVIIETGLDVTAQREAEAALRRTEHRYSNVFQAMAVSFWELDFTAVGSMVRRLLRQGVSDLSVYFRENPGVVDEMIRSTHVLDVNESSVKLFGRGNKNEMLSSLEPYWPRESRSAYAESVVAAVRGDPYYATETRLSAIDGREFDVWFTACFPPDMMARGKLLIGITDISATKKARLELERSKERYHTLFHFMPISLTQVDATRLFAKFQKLRAEGVTELSTYIDEHPEFIRQATDAIYNVEANQRALEIMEADRVEQMLGPVSIFWTESQEVMRRALEARFRGEPRFQSEVKLRTFKNNIRHGYLFSDYATPLGPLGVGMVGVVDITDRVKAQVMVEKLQSEFAHAARVSTLGELTASLAHEINQPLGAIHANALAALRWLDRSVPDLEEVKSWAARTRDDSRRAADIIQRVRAMATRKEPEREPTEINTILREVVLFLSWELRSVAVTTSMELANGLPDVIGDRIQLQQVVANLAINAIHAMRDQDTRVLTLRSGRDGEGFVYVDVEDTGAGLDKTKLDILFQSFFTTKQNGMGVGLPISRSIVEAHGGRIEAFNRVDRAGARFRFTLPVESRPA